MISKDDLYRMYVIEKMTTKEIAKSISCSSTSISNWLKKYDIPTRNRKEAQRAVKISYSELYDLYVTKDLSIDSIAKKIGSSEISVSSMLKEFEIQIKDKARKIKNSQTGVKLSPERRLFLSEIAKNRTGEKSPRYNAKLTNETKQKISNSLKGRFRKHLNPNWKNGGIAKFRSQIMGQFEYREWRDFIYKRDNYTCKMCNNPSKGNIQAHHIHPVSLYPDKIIDKDNGVTLCKPCHLSIKNKEGDYIDFFQKAIKPI